MIRVDLAAAAASLAAGEPAVDHRQLTAMPGCFVRQLALELVKSNIADSLGHAVILHHASNVQILDRNEWFGFRQFTGDLMKCVASNVRHSGVRPCEFDHGFVPVGAAFFAPRNCALKSFDLFECFFECAGIGILRAIR